MTGADLTGVPETALWTLRNRAVEAARPDAFIDDPHAVRLFEQLAGDDLDRFGKPSQTHPLRALAFDREIRDYLDAHPGASVVALGEGLQTSYWRLDRPDVRWFSIDLPEMVAVQERLLPAEPDITRIGVSALDRSWLEEVPTGPAIISAEGLFMYLPREDVHALIADMAARFPGGRLIYDSIPGWFSRMTQRGKVRLTERYVAPPMPHSQTVDQGAELPKLIPGVVGSRQVALPPGRGLWGSSPVSAVLRRVADLPIVRNGRPSITALDFAEA